VRRLVVVSPDTSLLASLLCRVASWTYDEIDELILNGKTVDRLADAAMEQGGRFQAVVACDAPSNAWTEAAGLALGCDVSVVRLDWPQRGRVSASRMYVVPHTLADLIRWLEDLPMSRLESAESDRAGGRLLLGIRWHMLRYSLMSRAELDHELQVDRLDRFIRVTTESVQLSRLLGERLVSLRESWTRYRSMLEQGAIEGPPGGQQIDSGEYRDPIAYPAYCSCGLERHLEDIESLLRGESR
jgi:hypothetical protein